MDNDLNETVIDNSRLEELVKEEMTPEMQYEYLNILKESRLLMPVVYSDDFYKNIENAQSGDVFETGPQSGFNIQYLVDDNGNRAIPLFTSEEKMEEINLKSSLYVLYMSDLADILKQTDKYSIITINPFTQYNLSLSVDVFLSLFDIESEDDISNINNDNLRQLINREHCDDNIREIIEELSKSIMIAGCVDVDDKTNFVLIWNEDDKAFLPLFTDIDEFKKIYADYEQDVYPGTYYFKDLLSVAEGDFVINPASESLELSLDLFKE